MRCASCHSYIPDIPTTIAETPVQCPACGQRQEKAPFLQTEPPPLPLKAEQSEKEIPEVFAPFFTIQTKLSFSLARGGTDQPVPHDGSLSFGPEGLSIVTEEGCRWEKIYYRDLGPAKLRGDLVVLPVRSEEIQLVFFHSWLPPELPTWIANPRRNRALVFIELLDCVKRGLTPAEVSFYRRRLQ